MKPVMPGDEFKGDHYVLGVDQPEYEPLPSRITDDGEVYTLWEFTDEEIALIRDGKRLALRILTFHDALQPVALAVEAAPNWEDFLNG